MITKIFPEKILCGLDIGHRSIKAGLVKTGKSDDSFTVLGVSESKTKGFKNTSVTDLGELSECIHAALQNLWRKTGCKLNDVQLGVGGSLVGSQFSAAMIPLVDKGSKVITFMDIKKAIRQAQFLGLKVDEEVLHDFPQYYKVDDINIALNPLGLYGRKLEVNLLLITANITRIQNIVKAVNQAGYEAENLFFSSYAASLVSLTEQVKKTGGVLIDIGSEVTTFLMFKNGILKYFTEMSIGGENITKCIAQAFGLPRDLAEEIKESHAMAAIPSENINEEILIKNDTSYLSVKRQKLCQAIEIEVEKLVLSIKEAIQQCPLADQINSGIIMTGGGTLLPGLIERVEKQVTLPVSLGKIFMTNTGISNIAIFLNAIGLAQTGYLSSLKFPLSGDRKEHWTRSLCDRVRELYQEYF